MQDDGTSLEPASLPPPPPPLPPPSRLANSLPLQPKTAAMHYNCGQNAAALNQSSRLACFVDKDRPFLKDLGPVIAMRSLDGLRRHNATETESDELGASGRLDVQDRAAILTLCGCKRGIRLTSDEMKTLQRVTTCMAESSTRLESCYDILILNMRMAKAGQGQEHGSAEAFFAEVNTWVGLFEELQALVKQKQDELKHWVTRQDCFGTPSQAEAEKMPFPIWLCILVNIYEITNNGSGELRTPTELSGNSNATSPISAYIRNPTCGPDDLYGNKPPCAPTSETGKDAGTGCASGERLAGADVSPVGVCLVETSFSAFPAGGTASAPLSLAATQAVATMASTGQAGVPHIPASQTGIDAAVFPSAASIDCLAKFSRFLALVLSSRHEREAFLMTERERWALEELVRASDDGSDRHGEIVDYDIASSLSSSPVRRKEEGSGFHSDNNNKNHHTSEISGATGKVEERFGDERVAEESRESRSVATLPLACAISPPSLTQPIRSIARSTTAVRRPVRYWSKRFHRFLSSVRELKTVPGRDDESLDKVMLEASLMTVGRRRQRGRSPPSSSLASSCSSKSP